MDSFTDIHNLLDNQPYKFGICISTFIFLSSFVSNLFDIDIGKLRSASFLIMIYGIGIWIYDNHVKASLKDDVYNEYYGTQEADLYYEKSRRNLNAIYFLLSIFTIFFIFA